MITPSFCGPLKKVELYEELSQKDEFESKAQGVECEYEEPKKAREWVERIESNKDRIVLSVDPEAPDEKIAKDREETLMEYGRQFLLE